MAWCSICRWSIRSVSTTASAAREESFWDARATVGLSDREWGRVDLGLMDQPAWQLALRADPWGGPDRSDARQPHVPSPATGGHRPRCRHGRHPQRRRADLHLAARPRLASWPADRPARPRHGHPPPRRLQPRLGPSAVAARRGSADVDGRLARAAAGCRLRPGQWQAGCGGDVRPHRQRRPTGTFSSGPAGP